MKAVLLAVAFCLLAGFVRAEVAPVEVRVPENGVWVGQRMQILINLRTQGSFGGATDFSTPQIPGGFLIKVGGASVSSEQLEGETYFVQTHEFAFYSQRDGTLEIPSFPVRFGSREGFTGPVTDRTEVVPATKVMIRRPPGTDAEGFLVTTDSYELREQWEPSPGATLQGTVFKRTIIQRASNIPGMVLPPAPLTTPDGVKVYPPDVTTADKANRGDLVGERRETITYLAQQPGTVVLPTLTYQWWNPRTEKLETQTLPAVTFDIAPAPSVAAPATRTTTRSRSGAWLALFLILAVAFWQRQRLGRAVGRLMQWLRPPDRVAARRLLRACRRGDGRTAFAEWNAWKAVCSDSTSGTSPELHDALLALQRHLYGPTPVATWQPGALSAAFRAHLKRTPPTTRSQPTSLPPLNPIEL